MPWLITITIDGTPHKISNEELTLADNWKNYVISFDPISYKMDHKTGGYIRPRLGGIVLSPELFDGDYPPPFSMPLKAEFTDTNEAAAITVLNGTAHCTDFNESSVNCELYGEDYDTTINSVTFADTLENIFTTYCGVSYLNLTLNTDACGSPTPTIARAAVARDEILIDVLSEMAAAVNYCFYIEDGTLYLIYLTQNNGVQTVDEFTVGPVPYKYPKPISLLVAGNYTLSGTHAYGGQITLKTDQYVAGGSVVTYLTTSLILLERAEIQLEIPMVVADIPVFGKKINFTDASVGPGTNEISSWFRVRSKTFTSDGEFVIVSGEGVIT